jgi:hypothetical protein
VPGPNSRNAFKRGDYLARMQGAKKGDTDGTEVFLSPRTFQKERQTYTTSKNMLYAEFVSNNITKANNLQPKRNTSGKKLHIKVQLKCY